MKDHVKVMDYVKFAALFLMIASAYFVWGGFGALTLFSAQKMFMIQIMGLLVLLIASASEFTKQDWTIAAGIGGIILIPLFFLYSNLGYLQFYLQIPFMLAYIFLAGKCSLNKIMEWLLLVFSVMYVVIVFAKLALIRFGVAGFDWWINENLIAGPVFFACMLGFILIDRLIKKETVFFQLALSAVGLTAFYFCLSWTPLFSYLLFLIIAYAVKFNQAIYCVVQKRSVWYFVFIAAFVLVPILTYIFASFYGFGISLSNRTRIWREFFNYWVGNIEYMLIGAKGRFQASFKSLATHSAYLDLLWAYGLIGYGILFSGITALVFRFKQMTYSYNQILCLLAFLMVCLHATMENYFSSFHWLPMVLVYLPLFINQEQKAASDASTVVEENQLEG